MRERITVVGLPVEVKPELKTDFEPIAEVIGNLERFNIKNKVALDRPYMVWATPS